MNYFEQHVGDTWLLMAELSPLQRGIFSSLQLLYFRDEIALPDSPPRLRAWCGLRRRTEFDALEYVLEHCFELGDDGRWHVEDWDEQIAEYQRGEPDRAKRKAEKQAATNDRVTRQREEERRLRAALADIGRVVPSSVRGVRALRAFAEQHLGAAAVAVMRTAASVAPAPDAAVPRNAETRTETPVETRTETLETPPQEPSTSTHFPSPPTAPQGPDGGGETQVETADGTRDETLIAAFQVRVTTAAAALTAAGVPVPAADERLQRLVAAGYDAQDVLKHRPTGGFDPAQVRHPGQYLLAKTIKANSDGEQLRPKPSATVPASPAASAALAKLDRDREFKEAHAAQIAQRAATVRQGLGLPSARRVAERAAA